MSKLFRATVTENKRCIKDHYLLTLRPLKRTRRSRPGNFYMISVQSGHDPLLKRPFSVHRTAKDCFQILYRVVGRGTSLLSCKKPGDTLDVVGPLGNTFPSNKKRKKLLIAGGLGIAPLFGLAESLACGSPPEKPLLFYGARTSKELLCKKELKNIGIKPVLATDDGTAGKKGNVVTLLDEAVNSGKLDPDGCTVYACGPEPMLEALSRAADKYGIKGYAALEQNMACGIGTCLGCVVHTKDGLKRVCKEGPVFPMDEIIWNK